MAGLLPLADAGSEGRALVAVEHVSGAGDADCDAAHHNAFCQVLNATREPFVAAASAAHLAVAAPHAVFEIPARSALSPSAAHVAAPGARAPPLG
ncbi:MAG: hypothetical protein WEB88_00355 [Gemmatimonadota bacterium]